MEKFWILRLQKTSVSGKKCHKVSGNFFSSHKTKKQHRGTPGFCKEIATAERFRFSKYGIKISVQKLSHGTGYFVSLQIFIRLREARKAFSVFFQNFGQRALKWIDSITVKRRWKKNKRR